MRRASSAPSTAWSLHGVPLLLLRVAANHQPRRHERAEVEKLLARRLARRLPLVSRLLPIWLTYDDSDDEEQPWLEQMAALSAEQLAALGEDSYDEDDSDYEDDSGSDDNDDCDLEEEEDAAAALAEEAAEAEAEFERQKEAAAAAAMETAALEAARTLPISEFKDLESLMEATLRLVRAGAGSSAPPAASPPASGGAQPLAG